MSTALTIKDRLNSAALKNEVARVLPKHLTPDRFLRVTITALTKTPKLAQCDQASFFGCLLTLSQLGLEPDGRLAHLIPFENRKRNVTECQLILDYKGLVELAYRSGQVANLHADVVCDNDEFEYDRGVLTKHKIDFRKPRGDVYAVYAMCRFKDGSEKVDVMTVDDVEAIRKRSRAANSGPWVTDWNEMAKKTVFKRLSKWLPLSPEFRDAVEADGDKVVDVEEVKEVQKVQFSISETASEPQPAVQSAQSIALESALTKAGITFDRFKESWVIKYSERAPEVNSYSDLTDDEISDINDRMDVRDGNVFWKTGGAK